MASAADTHSQDRQTRATSDTSRSLVYVGGWADGAYPYRTYALDRSTGALSRVGDDVDLGESPSYTAGSADGRFVYVANEASKAQPGVTVAALADTGAPARRMQAGIDGGALVFTSIVPGGKLLLAADYARGRALVFPIHADGSLGGLTDVHAFAPPAGGDSAQTHSFVPHPSGRFAYAPNKATDRIAQFALDGSGKLTPLHEPFAHGDDEPRVIAFHPAGELAYVMHEKASTLVTYRVDLDGTLRKLDRKSTLPPNATGASLGAHVLVHPSGKYVYVSNRDGDLSTIASFALAADGKPRLLGHTLSGGKGPRHFDVDPSGAWMVVANQGTRHGSDGTLAVFAIAPDGSLSPHGTPVGGLREPTSAALVTQPRR